MSWLWEQITDWIKSFFVDAIMANLTGIFDDLNTKVGEIAGEVGLTPAGWNGNIFNLIRNISDTVIVPIAGLIITFVLCYELITMVLEKNNMHDVDTFNFFKYFFKACVAIFLVSNTFTIVNAVFEVGQSVVTQSAGIIARSTRVTMGNLNALRTTLEAMGIGELIGLLIETTLLNIGMSIISICITIVIAGHMIEIYLFTSVAPIPFATFTNREWGQIGNNYLKGLLALSFQGFLIMVCVGIYAALVQGVATSTNIHATIWTIAAYTVLLCFTLFKSGGLAKSIFNAH